MNSNPPDPTTTPIPGYFSKTMYDVNLAQADGIIRVASYHRKDFDLAVIWFPHREHANIMDSISSTFRHPSMTLGQLDRLPLELTNDICLQLDMCSLFRFRQTNLRARHIVDSLPEYQVIATSALNCFCALLRTGAASRVTLSGFYQRLCEETCSVCGVRYGDLVSLQTWTRCCTRCIRERPTALDVTTTNAVQRLLRLSTASVKNLPSLQTLPGIYSMARTRQMDRVQVVDLRSALSTGVREDRMYECMINNIYTPGLAFRVCCALPSYNPRTKRIQNGVSCAGCQLALETNTYPSESNWIFDIRDRVYSTDEFLKHFEWCEQAQHLWTSSALGTSEPASYPKFCRKGGFFGCRE